MLHALPALLDDLEYRLIHGEDPQPLLASVRWSDVMDWPQTREDAIRLKLRLHGLVTLIQGLEAPLRATLAAFGEGHGYQKKGGIPLPKVISSGFHEQV